MEEETIWVVLTGKPNQKVDFRFQAEILGHKQGESQLGIGYGVPGLEVKILLNPATYSIKT